jgi:hypothetical protein
MNDDNTQDGSEPSPASAGSHGLTFDDWYKQEPGLRYYGVDFRWIARAAWDAAMQQTAKPAITDVEWDEIEGMVSDYQEIAEFNEERCHPHYAEKARRRAAMLIGLLERLG